MRAHWQSMLPLMATDTQSVARSTAVILMRLRSLRGRSSIRSPSEKSAAARRTRTFLRQDDIKVIGATSSC